MPKAPRIPKIPKKPKYRLARPDRPSWLPPSMRAWDPGMWKFDPTLNPWPFPPGWMGRERWPEQMWGTPPDPYPAQPKISFGFNKPRQGGWGGAGYNFGMSGLPESYPYGKRGMPTGPMFDPPTPPYPIMPKPYVGDVTPV